FQDPAPRQLRPILRKPQRTCFPIRRDLRLQRLYTNFWCNAIKILHRTKNTMAQRSGSPCQIQGTLSGGRVINAERFAQLFLPLVWPVPAPAR
ncbi:MAG: hypothetical protein WCF86_00360, partial [Pseudolabrys sp.]